MVQAIPPNTPITNNASVEYLVGGVVYTSSDSSTLITDPAAGNSPPYALSLDPPRLLENELGGVVGVLNVADLDPNDVHTFVVSDPRFIVDGITLRLAPSAQIDFEIEPAISISIVVTDPAGGVFSTILLIDIIDVNEAPIALSLTNSTVVAGVDGAIVGSLIVVDPDVGDTFNYMSDDPRFDIVGGELKLVAGASLGLSERADVTVTVTDSGGLSYTQVFEVLATPPGGGGPITASIATYQYAPGLAVSELYRVSASQCDAGGGLSPLPAPLTVGGNTIDLTTSIDLAATGLLKSGDVLFIQVIDANANLDTNQIDGISLDVISESGDSESLVIYESTPNSGVFVGYVQSLQGAPVANSCQLEIDQSQQLTLRYMDTVSGLNLAQTNILVDPFGVVFDSATGTPVNGALITLVNAIDGTPATVFDDDGVTVVPASMVSGAGALASGAYRYPWVSPGDYRLEVTPPNRFSFPSQVPDATLQAVSGAPFVLGPGARGLTFSVPVGPAVKVDLPLDLLPITPTASAIQILGIQPGGAQSEYVGASACYDGNQFVPAGQATSLGAGVVNIPGDVKLTPINRLSRGDVLFIKITDPDQDKDPFAPDWIEVTVTVSGQMDVERVQLRETNDSTGIFTGYLQTATDTAVDVNNCLLEADPAAAVLVSYVDATDATDTSSMEFLYDPGFTFFSSTDGGLVSGATVTLIDVNTGQPATNAVFGRDGLSPYPATVQVGGQATDAAGVVYDFAAGTFQFPVINPGDYRLEVDAPQSYTFPSQVADSDLNDLPAGPFILSAGSRGGVFTVSLGVPAAFDLPVDPISAELFVSKQASKETAAVGDFVQYRVTITNGDTLGTVSNVQLLDQLPLGFRLVKNSVVKGQGTGDKLSAADIVVADDGRSLTIPVAELAPGAVQVIRYVTEVTAGAKLGIARNAATVVGLGVGSANVAFADVQVKEDLLRSKSIIVGQVVEGSCDAKSDTKGEAKRNSKSAATSTVKGVPNVRVWLETGVFVVTDAEGKYHFEDIEPGSHVVQLDLASLPQTLEPAQCEANTRFAGSTDSQFVDLQAGTLWRADFHLAKKPDFESEIFTRLDAEADDGVIRYKYHIRGGSVPLENMRATLMLDDQLAFMSGSARLNGQPINDPSGLDMGAATFKLPDTTAAFNHQLEFDAFVKTPRGLIETKATTLFVSAAGHHRTEVNVNELSLNWPSSLIMVAQSLGPIKDMSPANRKALRQARKRNAEALPESAMPLRNSIKDEDLSTISLQSEVHEPSRGTHQTQSAVTQTKVSVAREVSQDQPYQLPELDRGKAPPFDLSWLRTNQTQRGFAWPPENYNPVLPAVEVVVVHAADEKPVLLVDGKLVDPVTLEGTSTDHNLGLSFTRWDNVTISERDSVIEAKVLDREGQTVESYSRPIHFSGAPARAELVESESYLVADGLYPPVIAVRLFDRAGYPLRAGTTGEFNVGPPYAALDKAKHLENLDNKFNNLRYQVLREGIAYIQLEPTTATEEVELLFQFDPVRSDVVRARLTPGMRDWIMVGLLEGSYAHNSLDGNLRSLGQQNLEDETLTDGRVAFYAKGMVRGDWLLTTAYDTDKKFERKLREQIDPNQFYTLYGDGTQQLYDADSQRKLYLKLERSRFSGLFGNFDTGFDRSELARYNRRLNGVQLGYFGPRVEVKAFASETDQSFIRDEIRGDGTSGIYRLSSRALVANSETVRIVTRDRFATEKIIEETTLTRFVDYTVDYDKGTLLFKQPIFSQDHQFNPTFIEVEYQAVGAQASDEIVAGTRVAYLIDQRQSELALTYVNDGTLGRGGDLLAADLTWQMNTAQKLTVELAQSDTDESGTGDAYLLELEHNSANLAGRLYVREQEQAFGLGNQSVLEAGTRKIGVEGEYRLNEDMLLRAESFQQRQLEQGTQRFVINALGEWRWQETHFNAGLQSVKEDTASADNLDATQVLLGVAQNFWGNKLVLRSDAEIDVSSKAGNTDYPSRSILGAEYQIYKDVSIVAEQELTWGNNRDTQDTRFGLRARPWTGGDINTYINRQSGENGERLFATTGLLQQWRINDRWLYDFGFDRVQTLSQSGVNDPTNTSVFNPNVPPASGSFDNDFTALFTGFGYRRDAWDISTRLEFHHGDQTDKWNLLAGANHQLSEGKVVAASLSVLNEETASGNIQDNSDFRLGFAWRPFDSAWSLLNRLDLMFENRTGNGFDTRTVKWVNNFNANYKNASSQLALQLGVKYVVENIDNDEFSGITALYGLEYRYDLTPKWDLGVRTAVLHSVDAQVMRYAYGVSVGHSFMKNLWMSVGYNVDGFNDNDFIAAEYTAKGPYVKFRMKLGQDLANRFLAFTGLSRGREANNYANGR